MNYKKHYTRLIERARDRVLEGYTEKHHVVPRCLGGSDDPANIVSLTAEEHYVAHQLLTKMYPDHDGLLYAAVLMSMNTNGNRPKNKLYGWLRTKYSMRMKGRVLSEETKQKISNAKKGKVLSKTHRQALSIAHLGKVSPKKGKSFEEIYDDANKALEVKKRISNATAGKPRTQIQCPHCGKTGGRPGMRRYHFENCGKERPTSWNKGQELSPEHRSRIREAHLGKTKQRVGC